MKIVFMGASMNEKVSFPESRKKIVDLINAELESRKVEKPEPNDSITPTLLNWKAAVETSLDATELPPIFTSRKELDEFENLPLTKEKDSLHIMEMERAREYSMKTAQDISFLQDTPLEAVNIWGGILKTLESISKARPMTLGQDIQLDLVELKKINDEALFKSKVQSEMERRMQMASNIYRYRGKDDRRITDILKVNDDCIELTKIARKVFDAMGLQGMPQT